MDKVNDDELMSVFRAEAQDLINGMRKILSLFKNDIQLANDSSRLQDLFRYSHTLKGSSDSVGCSRLNEIAVVLQEIFRAAKEGRFKISTDIIPLLSQAVEACQALLNGEKVEGLDELLKRLEEVS